MRGFLVALAITAGVVTTACGRGGSPASPGPLGVVTLEERMLNDDSGGIPDSVQIVIRDPAVLDDAWARATSRQNPPPPVPRIDFDRHMLLLVAIGRKQPEIELRVDSVGVRRELMADGRQRDILAVMFTVTEGCRRFNRDAYPLEIVRSRRFDGDVRFIGRRRTPDCP